jgi:hypothetical protein
VSSPLDTTSVLTSTRTFSVRQTLSTSWSRITSMAVYGATYGKQRHLSRPLHTGDRDLLLVAPAAVGRRAAGP